MPISDYTIYKIIENQGGKTTKKQIFEALEALGGPEAEKRIIEEKLRTMERFGIITIDGDEVTIK